MARGPETYWVRNASVAAQRGRAAQKGRMPVRQQKAGTMAGVPYDWLRQHWAETAVMPVRQRKLVLRRQEFRTMGWDSYGLRQQGCRYGGGSWYYEGRSSVRWAENSFGLRQQ